MNTKQITGSIFLDLKKAFDVISHDKILNKLFYYGIRNKEHCWFFNYLVGRKQCVSMYQCTSDFVTIKSGVPQGSILGPLLFCLARCAALMRQMSPFAPSSSCCLLRTPLPKNTRN